ncbi:hypothetical protein C8A03DRAFT_30749 [Achaetomium macrosporum]|uniref:Uncharacterized protein n=1 Tax=Achaetomium macrosporum TaxID=79813 RepID=A0AAN7HGK2_9PEZI|nr:hypothetical protein C8A03DRAFT_30749 [Achaetomium macrosporum]
MVANFAGVAVAIAMALWTIFTWFYTERRRRKEQAKHKKELEGARRDSAEKAAHKATQKSATMSAHLVLADPRAQAVPRAIEEAVARRVAAAKEPAERKAL